MSSGVSIIAACKNRNDNLLTVLPSWVGCNGINEIILVDWDSDVKVIETIDAILLSTNMITVVEVKNEPRWILSHALNIAARIASFDTLLKLDCDDLLDPNFISAHSNLGAKNFYCGNWALAADDNQTHLNGVLYVQRKNFMHVNGYNEYIQTYGWDDTDLYNRLGAAGLRALDIDTNFVSHIPHDNTLRSTFDPFADIHYNRFLVNYLPWSPAVNMSLFYSTPSTIYYPNVQRMIIRGVVEKVYAKVPADAADKARNDLDNYFKQLGLANPCGHWNLYCQGQYNVLYINCRNGPGNRLRALASAYNMFNYLLNNPTYNSFSWRFVIIWHRDYHCDASFDSIFTVESLINMSPGNIYLLDNAPFLPDTTVKIPGEMVSVPPQFPSTTLVTPNTPTAINEVLNQISVETSHLHLYIESASVINFPFNTWAQDCAFIRALVPTPEVQSIVADQQVAIADALARLGSTATSIAGLVGVQIRIGQSDQPFDNISDWPADKRAQWEYWRSQSGYDKFLKQMRILIAGGAAGFYLASDSEWVYERMEEEFGEQLFYIKRNVWDRSTEEIIYGLADAILLGQTSIVYGSNWSSYAELIAKLSNVPLKLAGRDF